MRCFFLLMLSLFLMSIAQQKVHFQKVISIEEYELMMVEIAEFNPEQLTTRHPADTSLKMHSKKYFEVTNSVQVQQKVYNFFSELKGQYSWFVLMNEYCRYSAYILPVFKALAAAADEIDLFTVPLTENEAYSHSFSSVDNHWFPTLICTDKSGSDVLFSWNSPAVFIDAKLGESFLSLTDEKLKMTCLDDWFEKDHGQSIQLEIYELFKKNIN
jgi:Thioredoxin